MKESMLFLARLYTSKLSSIHGLMAQLGQPEEEAGLEVQDGLGGRSSASCRPHKLATISELIISALGPDYKKYAMVLKMGQCVDSSIAWLCVENGGLKIWAHIGSAFSQDFPRAVGLLAGAAGLSQRGPA